MINLLWLIPIIGCLICIFNDKPLNSLREELLHDLVLQHYDLDADKEKMSRALNIVISLTLIMFIFLWPLILLHQKK